MAPEEYSFFLYFSETTDIIVNMNGLIKNIFEIKRSKAYIEYNNYHNGNLFGIVETSRLEQMHSGFLKWLFDSSSSHGLGTFPIAQLIKTCGYVKNRPENNNARLDSSLVLRCFDNQYIKTIESIEREKSCGSNRGYIDLLIKIRLEDGILPIVIENKVNSKEHDNQTERYFTVCEEWFKDRIHFKEPIYLFLTPVYNSMPPRQKEFLSITYQDLVDNVIEPSLWKSKNSISCNNINVYLQCLSFQSDNEKGESIMAISTEEKKILHDFVTQNKNLLCSVLNELIEEDDDSEKIRKIVTDSLRDYGRYSFEGQDYNKAKLVLAVVQKYVNDKNPTYDELKKAFPDDISGNTFGVVKRIGDIPDKHKGIGGTLRRYYVDFPIVLQSGEEVLVSTQWGIGNIEGFINKATELGYSVTRN